MHGPLGLIGFVDGWVNKRTVLEGGWPASVSVHSWQGVMGCVEEGGIVVVIGSTTVCVTGTEQELPHKHAYRDVRRRQTFMLHSMRSARACSDASVLFSLSAMPTLRIICLHHAPHTRSRPDLLRAKFVTKPARRVVMPHGDCALN